MGCFTISNVVLKGISAAVPGNGESNYDLKGYETEELHKLIATLGIEKRRVAPPSICASDLCIAAAEKLIAKIGWKKEEIGLIVFVSQTPDHQLPGNSLHIQHRLGLPKSCIAFDINQGCAGYVYGLSMISSFMSSSRINKGLLLVGDTITKLVSPHDKSLIPIFSDAGTATALEFQEGATPIPFNLSSEGEDYEAIIVPEGGARNCITPESLTYKDAGNSIQRKGTHLAMKGLDVFNFSLKKVSPNIEELMKFAGQNEHDIQHFVLHQANKLILEAIGKKLSVAEHKIPSSLKDFGNTSGATIPLTILTNLATQGKISNGKMVLAGFGVGLSLASAIVDFKDVVCTEIIELP